ncbi:bifunctional cytochrome P450/NADPH--P450 reductase [Metabacillus sp. 84]|uniref:bifunctional cytochrome P450/NADPH--P450 reductase n=1 Tax=Metabacillus sp. 84 TaxID=3404705 RepID=UPI003CE88204
MTSLRQIPELHVKEPDGGKSILDPGNIIQSLIEISKKAGPIFRFDRPRNGAVFLSSHKFAAEVFDEARFDKSVGAALQNLRPFSGDGLFTSWTHEPNWKKAHGILMPSFSQKAMKGYHMMMADIAVQLVQKWERMNEGESIHIPEDMTKLTLDTIGLCGFNYRFNSFYRTGFHPFVESMNAALLEAMSQLTRSHKEEALYKKELDAFHADIGIMFGLVDQLIASRRKQPENRWPGDLLSHMLRSRDPETGEMLNDENIRYQMITFLIAGHETTSGLLSFTMYELCKNPAVLKKAQEEADRVLTSPVPSYKEVKKLKYIQMIVNEALRLWPTVPAISLYAKNDEIIGGEFALQKGQEVTVLLPRLHRDPAVWGKDADVFKPGRFEDMSTIPPHAYKPFGNGQRACIGQQFALHEATLALGLLLKHFDFADDANYQLAIKETLSWKPHSFTLKAVSRKKWTGSAMIAEHPSAASSTRNSLQEPAEDAHRTPLLILYGSNMGTSEELAMELAGTAGRLGFQAKTGALDDFSGKLPKKGAVLIITSSYNGNPPDNAVKFFHWLGKAGRNELEGVTYTVFGCGDRSWSATYQRVPADMDQKLEEKGAFRLCVRGEGDADGDFFGSFKAWEHEMWRALAARFELDDAAASPEEDETLSIEFVSSEPMAPAALKHQAFIAEVTVNKELQSAASARSTRYLELSLPKDVTYREGGHIGILPHNCEELVNRVLLRFGLSGRERVVLRGEGAKTAHLPKGETIEVRRLLTEYVELQDPVTKTQLKILAEATVCPPHRFELEAMLKRYEEDILPKRISMLELLENYLACELNFERYISLLPPLKPRYYSVSSSPQRSPGKVSLTVSVLKEQAWSGSGEYHGIASCYLARLLPGAQVTCFIKEPQAGFEMPSNPATPIIMVGPGTGIAPFRGFLQRRRILQEQGYSLGEAHLYFGCRTRKHDFLYEEELKEAERDGLVILHTAFSREDGKAKTYVQHLMKKHASQVISLFDQHAHLYICGDGSKMAPDVEAAMKEIYQAERDSSEEEAAEWLADLQQQGRVAKDVWAGK